MDHQGQTELDKIRSQLDYWAKRAVVYQMERNAARLRIKDLELENLHLSATINRLENQQYYL